MMGILSLPTELHLEIFSYLCNDDLKSIRLSDRGLGDIAGEGLFSGIQIDLIGPYTDYRLHEPPEAFSSRIGSLFANELICRNTRTVALRWKKPKEYQLYNKPMDMVYEWRAEFYWRFCWLVRDHAEQLFSPVHFPRLCKFALECYRQDLLGLELLSMREPYTFFNLLETARVKRGVKAHLDLNVRSWCIYERHLEEYYPFAKEMPLDSLRVQGCYPFFLTRAVGAYGLQPSLENYLAIVGKTSPSNLEELTISNKDYTFKFLWLLKPNTFGNLKRLYCFCNTTFAELQHGSPMSFSGLRSLRELTIFGKVGRGWLDFLAGGVHLTHLVTNDFCDHLVSYIERIPENTLRQLELPFPVVHLMHESNIQALLTRFWRSLARQKTSLNNLSLLFNYGEFMEGDSRHVWPENEFERMAPWCVNGYYADADHLIFPNLKKLDALVYTTPFCISDLMRIISTSPKLQAVRAMTVGSIREDAGLGEDEKVIASTYMSNTCSSITGYRFSSIHRPVGTTLDVSRRLVKFRKEEVYRDDNVVRIRCPRYVLQADGTWVRQQTAPAHLSPPASHPVSESDPRGPPPHVIGAHGSRTSCCVLSYPSVPQRVHTCGVPSSSSEAASSDAAAECRGCYQWDTEGIIRLRCW